MRHSPPPAVRFSVLLQAVGLAINVVFLVIPEVPRLVVNKSG